MHALSRRTFVAVSVEEPCPWEEVSETGKAPAALDMAVAAGEQDSSHWKFHPMMSVGMK